jgi:hypothetical protein
MKVGVLCEKKLVYTSLSLSLILSLDWSGW